MDECDFKMKSSCFQLSSQMLHKVGQINGCEVLIFEPMANFRDVLINASNFIFTRKMAKPFPRIAAE